MKYLVWEIYEIYTISEDSTDGKIAIGDKCLVEDSHVDTILPPGTGNID
jgi:hypothetical protein